MPQALPPNGLRGAPLWHDACSRPFVPPFRYERHEPEKSVLYRIVREHWKTFLRFAEERDPRGIGLPRYVRNAFEEYLRCGILQHGFVRVRCPGCGDDSLVPFS